MAVFERDRGSRRFYSLSGDDLPSASGGIPTGSMLTHTDTGDRFIYNGNTREWLPYIGEEDLLGMLEDIRDGINALLPHVRVARAAAATMANDQSGGDYSTDDE